MDLASGSAWGPTQWEVTPSRPGEVPDTTSPQLHTPCNSVPALWPCPRPHPNLFSSCLVLAHVLLSQEAGRSPPVCTDTPLSGLFLSPLPNINLRSAPSAPSTHPPAYKNLLHFLSSFPPTPTPTCLLPPIFSFPMILLDTAHLFLTPKSMKLVPRPSYSHPETTLSRGLESAGQRPAMEGGRKDQ